MTTIDIYANIRLNDGIPDDATIARYDVITANSSLTRRRDIPFPRIVAHRDRDGVLSGIEVVVWWGGHEGRATISGKHTITSLADDCEPLRMAIYDADVAALTELVSEVTAAVHIKDIGNNRMDFGFVYDVADGLSAALGVEWPLNAIIPTTHKCVLQWRSAEGFEDLVSLEPAFVPTRPAPPASGNTTLTHNTTKEQ